MTKGTATTIVLDRDGVINHDSDNYIKCADEWIPITGSMDAIAKLHQKDYQIIIATNQSGLARGYFDEVALAAIHQKLNLMVEDAGGFVSAIFYCPHLPGANCQCRKPKTGMLKQAEEELGISLANSYLIGDSLKDLQTAVAFQMRPLLVRTGKGRDTELSLTGRLKLETPVFDNLEEAADWVLAK